MAECRGIGNLSGYLKEKMQLFMPTEVKELLTFVHAEMERILASHLKMETNTDQ